ncbi:Uncharacterised protein [Legionella busanensis]|uniref:Uncharacterized protein n=1 Tax=Legionella busanensis TaxID=190655 RepID=A0A378JP66_9GAMM|nr:Uncharacterised protein [Legionella busanensis]
MKKKLQIERESKNYNGDSGAKRYLFLTRIT